MQGSLLSHCFSQTEGTEVAAQNYTQETFKIRQKTVKKSDAFPVCEFHGWMGNHSDYPEAIPIWACPKFWTIRLGSDLKRACPNLRQTQIINCRGYIPWYPHHLPIISPFWLIYVDFTHIHIIVRGIGLITQSIICWV
jgi:hypothetical protein